MGARIHTAEVLRNLAGIPEFVEVNGTTVRDCLTDLACQYPDSQKWIFDEKGDLQILILLNQEHSYLTDLSKPVVSNDEIRLIMMIAGG